MELLAEMASRFGVCLHCFVLMDNHYHLMLELREANLSRAAQWLNLSYSMWSRRCGRDWSKARGNPCGSRWSLAESGFWRR